MVFCAGVVYPWLQKDLFLGVDAKSSIVTADRFHKDPRHERLQPRHAYGKGAACGGGAQLAPPAIASDFGAIRSRRHRVDAGYESGVRVMDASGLRPPHPPRVDLPPVLPPPPSPLL